MSRFKSIIILSEKSSGSSACQELLAQHAHIQHVTKTRHYQNETLYWTKAASILQKPQTPMVDSEVPIPPQKARQDLLSLLQNNIEQFTPSAANDEQLIIQGWHALCQQFAPIFIEKSPHHLCQWSALELIMHCTRQLSDVDFLLIGLIRNPMATLYSQYTRWKSPPSNVEAQWVRAYTNLLKLKELMGNKLVILRYEDIVQSLDTMAPIFEFCEVTPNVASYTYLHQKSLAKWQNDSYYGYALSEQTICLAKQFGYPREELTNKTYMLWPAIREISRTAYLTKKSIKNIARVSRDKAKLLLDVKADSPTNYL